MSEAFSSPKDAKRLAAASSLTTIQRRRDVEDALLRGQPEGRLSAEAAQLEQRQANVIALLRGNLALGSIRMAASAEELTVGSSRVSELEVRTKSSPPTDVTLEAVLGGDSSGDEVCSDPVIASPMRVSEGCRKARGSPYSVSQRLSATSGRTSSEKLVRTARTARSSDTSGASSPLSVDRRGRTDSGGTPRSSLIEGFTHSHTQGLYVSRPRDIPVGPTGVRRRSAPLRKNHSPGSPQAFGSTDIPASPSSSPEELRDLEGRLSQHVGVNVGGGDSHACELEDEFVECEAVGERVYLLTAVSRSSLYSSPAPSTYVFTSTASSRVMATHLSERLAVRSRSGEFYASTEEGSEGGEMPGDSFALAAVLSEGSEGDAGEAMDGGTIGEDTPAGYAPSTCVEHLALYNLEGFAHLKPLSS